MPRHARIVLSHIAHHITQRGNYKQTVFEHQADYKNYCKWFRDYAEKYYVETYAYCLMSNHVHFIVTPKTEDGLARVFNTLHMKYAQYINKRRKVSGHLWQGRFFSCLLDDVHLYRAIRDVEQNPVRAKIVELAWQYDWSSAKEHVGIVKEIIPLSQAFDRDGESWKRYLRGADEEMSCEMRLKTQRGLAIGTEQFIQKAESKIKRSLVCLNPGRPKNNSIKRALSP